MLYVLAELRLCMSIMNGPKFTYHDQQYSLNLPTTYVCFNKYLLLFLVIYVTRFTSNIFLIMIKCKNYCYKSNICHILLYNSQFFHKSGMTDKISLKNKTSDQLSVKLSSYILMCHHNYNA